MRSRHSRQSVDIWPGWVDALSSLLMVVIFVLLVFMVAQFFLSTALSGRELALVQLRGEVSTLNDQLDAQRDDNADLRLDLARNAADLQAANQALEQLRETLALTERDRDTARGEIGALSRRIEAMTAETTRLEQSVTDAFASIEADRETVTLRLAEIASLQADIAALRTARTGLEQKLATQAAALAAAERTIESRDADLAAREAALAEQAAVIASQAADFDAQTVELTLSLEQADALLAELGQLRDRRQALEAELADADELTVLRQSEIDRADLRIETLVAALDETQAALDESQQLGAQSTAEVARLNAQLAEVQAEMAQLSAILDERERQSDEAGATVLVNSDRVNQALVDRVQQLLDEQNNEPTEMTDQVVEVDGQALAEVERYFSEFFQQLDSVLGERADLKVEGDRFVFQSKVLFESARADLGIKGQLQLSDFARTLSDLSQNIPPEIDWVLRVDGHTDSIPIETIQFPSNWELSAARAVSVVKFLIEEGVPENRLVAAAYGQYSPISTEEAEPNRRIEMKLDQR